MAVSQKVMFSTMILASLAVAFSTVAAAPQLAGYAGAMLQLVQRNSDGAGQVSVEAASLSTCDPACATGQCCLQTSPDTQATCSKTRLSGYSCVNPNVYSGSDPNLTSAVQQSVCPCAVGMICMATGPFTGVCSGFKK